ncbi:putative peptidase [Synechococcus phage S-CBS2]|uniref:putative peptidase n=1 Tax=Synechococcus phage S-CBS2 TaxID=753084 RepID=UPI000207842F|nr:putative peptidase [Synechococcus phage S-CBS2]ADF42442.1 putative peptidase [Synechococcus phage S-CBS2]
MIPVVGPVVQNPSIRHPAVDIACIPGSEVRAMANGHGTFHWDHDMGWVFTQGNISISHLDHKGVDRFYTVGEVISACGSTGRLSAGPHVHIEGPPEVLSRF